MTDVPAPTPADARRLTHSVLAALLDEDLEGFALLLESLSVAETIALITDLALYCAVHMHASMVASLRLRLPPGGIVTTGQVAMSVREMLRRETIGAESWEALYRDGFRADVRRVGLTDLGLTDDEPEAE